MLPSFGGGGEGGGGRFWEEISNRNIESRIKLIYKRRACRIIIRYTPNIQR